VFAASAQGDVRSTHLLAVGGAQIEVDVHWLEEVLATYLESLLARNKSRLQALIAVARKLLHAIFGIFRSGLKYEGTKLFPRIILS
jgi:hypothetical protein